MKFLKQGEVLNWCASRHLQLNEMRFLNYDIESLHCFSISLEDRPSRVIALADYLMPTWSDVPFAGALFWIRERGAGSDFSENTGAMILQQMRMAGGEAASLGEHPGQLFSATELVEFHSYFVLPMLFGWDAFVVPEGRDYFFFVSHDGIVEVVSRTPESLEEIRQRVLDWNPKPDSHWYQRLAKL